MTKADILTTNLGTIWTFEALSAVGRQWMRIHVDSNRNTPGYVQCEHRFGFDIAIGALDAGLTLQNARTGRMKTGTEGLEALL